MALFGVKRMGVAWSVSTGETVIEDVDFDESDAFVVHVRPRRSTECRCRRRGVRVPDYDKWVGAQLVGAWPLTLRCLSRPIRRRVNCPAPD